MYVCSGQVYIASTNYIWRLVSTPIPSQIRQLLTNKEFELALHLAVSLQIIFSEINQN